MFSFLKKEQSELLYTTDLHSHLIPGIDDGVKTLNESIELLQALQELGFKKVITTPHVMHHRYPNKTEEIMKGLLFVRAELKKHKMSIKVEVAAEYYLDEYFLRLLKQRDILTFNNNHVLFEMSYTNKPVNLEAIIYEIKVAGYQPVLAHPERYFFLHNDFAYYKKLKEMGVLFQVNINSFSGYYSKDVKKVAMKIAEEGLIDFLGSDIHKLRHFEHFSKNISSSLVKKIFAKNEIRNNQLF